MDDLERLTKERDELQAELLRWQRSFAGHVYVPDAEYAALAKKARDAEARVRELGSNQIPPGCVAVCEVCFKCSDDWPEAKHNAGNCNAYEHVELGLPCPLRSVSPSP